MKRMCWNAAAIAKLQTLADNGDTPAEAARCFGITRPALARVARLHRISFADGRKHRSDPRVELEPVDHLRARWQDLIGPMKTALRAELEADAAP